MTRTTARPRPTFLSLRWRLMLPVSILTLTVAMVGGYFLANSMQLDVESSQARLLTQSQTGVLERKDELGERLGLLADRLALEVRTGEDYEAALERVVADSDVTYAGLLDAAGVETLGYRWSSSTGALNQSSLVDFALERPVETVLDGESGANGVVHTALGPLLVSARGFVGDAGAIAVVLVGVDVTTALDAISLEGTELALYQRDGALLSSTLGAQADIRRALDLPREVYAQSLASADGHRPMRIVSIGGNSYRAVYVPFAYGGDELGLLGVMMADQIPVITASSRQLAGLTVAVIAAVLVIVAFVVFDRMVVNRQTRVWQVAEALASGERMVRTDLKPTDEVGAAGAALDRYAEVVQRQHDALYLSLRRQRREIEHLMGVLEALPDGVVIQDHEGGPLFLNERARTLLTKAGEQGARMMSMLGSDGPPGRVSLAPGLYTLGDPQRVEAGELMLNAQAAAVLNLAQERVGTLLVLRDITQQVQRERAQEALLSQLSQDVQQPLAEAARQEAHQQPMSAVARELSRHAVALQKLIVEMRELTMGGKAIMGSRQRALGLETLIWTVANEWRQVAHAAGLSLDVMIGQKGLAILGDERRLRWALGNIVDNAIKYTLPGGKLTLEIQEAVEGRAALRVRDNGVGIAPEDVPQVFERFFRGTPRLEDGSPLRVPGTGQGLSIARQIIESHGGRIHLKSKPGVGTAVYVTLPLTAPVSYALPQLQTDLEGETITLERQRRR